MVPVYSTKTLYILRERIQQHLLNNSLNFKDTYLYIFCTIFYLIINIDQFQGLVGPATLLILRICCTIIYHSYRKKNVAAVHLTNHMENKANRADYKTNFFQCQQTDGDYHPCQKVHPDFKTATLSQC